MFLKNRFPQLKVYLLFLISGFVAAPLTSLSFLTCGRFREKLSY